MTWVEPPGLGAVGLALSGRLQAGSWRREHFAALRLQTERPRIAGDPDCREGTVSSEARADGDLAAARDTSGGRSAHRSISKRVWVVWEQGRPRGRVGSCETPPWWPAVSSSRHVELRVPDGGDATRTRGHKATSKPRRTGAPAPRWPMRSAWRRGGSSGPASQPPVAAWGGASTRLNRDKLEREQRPRW